MTRSLLLLPLTLLVLCGICPKSADAQGPAPQSAAPTSCGGDNDAGLGQLRASLADAQASLVRAADEMTALRARLALKEQQFAILARGNGDLQRTINQAGEKPAQEDEMAASQLALVGPAKWVEDRLAIDGAELHLAGIAIDRTRSFMVGTILDSDQQVGSVLRCVPGEAGWSCANPAKAGSDLARMLVLNGDAKATDSASDEVREAERDAQAHHRGMWVSAP